jgi:hypothetical protein
MRVRIEFLKDGAVVKRFDRSVQDKAEAAQLAADIAKDSGIEHDARRISLERKFKALLTLEGARVEIIESKAVDEEDAKAVASKWAEAANVQFDAVSIAFLEA